MWILYCATQIVLYVANGVIDACYSLLILKFLTTLYKNHFCLTEKQSAEYIDMDWNMVSIRPCFF